MRRTHSIDNRINLIKHLKTMGEYNGSINRLATKYALSSSFLRALNDMGIIALSRKHLTWVGTQKNDRELAMLAMKRESSMREESRDMTPFQRSRDNDSIRFSRKTALNDMWADQQEGSKKLLSHYYRKHGVGTYFSRALEKQGYLVRDPGRSWNFIKDPSGLSVDEILKTEGEIRKKSEQETPEIKPQESPEPIPQPVKPSTNTPNQSNHEELCKFGAMVGARKSLEEISGEFGGNTLEVLRTARKMQKVIDTTYLMDEGRKMFDELFG